MVLNWFWNFWKGDCWRCCVPLLVLKASDLWFSCLNLSVSDGVVSGEWQWLVVPGCLVLAYVGQSQSVRKYHHSSFLQIWIVAAKKTGGQNSANAKLAQKLAEGRRQLSSFNITGRNSFQILCILWWKVKLEPGFEPTLLLQFKVATTSAFKKL